MMKRVEIEDIRKQDYFYDEAMKTLRTNIQLSGKRIKTILVSSCYPNEGKSDISISLARELSSIGKKVLLIDTDIRKSAYFSHFLVNQEVQGLSQFLSGQIEVKDLIYGTNYPNMDIIFGGSPAPDPSGLLGDAVFGAFMREIRGYYDYILCDTPPVGNIIDGILVAKYCDGAIFVVEQGAVSYRVAQKAVNQLRKAGCRILGTVLNKADTRRDLYYKKYGDYYRKTSTSETENS